MLVAAIWLIVIPKLKSVDQPLTSTITIQTPTEESAYWIQRRTSRWPRRRRCFRRQ